MSSLSTLDGRMMARAASLTLALPPHWLKFLRVHRHPSRGDTTLVRHLIIETTHCVTGGQRGIEMGRIDIILL